MKYCSNCGNQLQDTDQFCGACGSKINNAQPPLYFNGQQTQQTLQSQQTDPQKVIEQNQIPGLNYQSTADPNYHTQTLPSEGSNPFSPILAIICTIGLTIFYWIFEQHLKDNNSLTINNWSAVIAQLLVFFVLLYIKAKLKKWININGLTTSSKIANFIVWTFMLLFLGFFICNIIMYLCK